MAEDELCNARVYDDAGFVGGWGKERDRVCVCVHGVLHELCLCPRV